MPSCRQRGNNVKQTTDGLIIRENNNVGESDRFVTMLTRDFGVIQASVRGARRLKNHNGPATQLLCYSRLSLYQGREKYIVDDAAPLQVFFEVRGQLNKLALAQYFCELAAALAPREEPAEEPLRLLLNALHYLSEDTRPLPLIKAVVELRLLCGAGYTPNLIACAGCGKETGAVFSPVQGIMLCADCGGMQNALPLTPGVLAALRHIVYGPFDKCFAFSLSAEELSLLSRLCERFLLAQVDRSFNTLEFYHTLEV